MGIIKTATANNTGVSIYNTYKSALSAIDQLTKCLNTLQDQIVNMKINSENFTEEDWKEVETLRNEINQKISELNK